MITAAQLRAARGLLDWTRADLAKAANISPETVKNIEHGTFRPQENTADAIVKAFAVYDVVFTDDEGVKKKKELVRTFIGNAGYYEFLDDILNTMKGGGRTCQFNFSDSLFLTYGGERVDGYVKQMQSTPNIDARCLVPEGDMQFPVKHCVYKWLNKIHKDAVPYYLYGNKVAVLASVNSEELIWVSICSDSLAKAHLNHFDAYWAQADSIPATSKDYVPTTNKAVR
jgi:DNA-binding XRE family transcriptional regulator